MSHKVVCCLGWWLSIYRPGILRYFQGHQRSVLFSWYYCSICFLVQVWLSMYVRVWMNVHLCPWVWRPEVNVFCLPQSLLCHMFLRQDLSLNMNSLVSYLCKLANKPKGFPAINSPGQGYSQALPGPAFMWVLRSWPQSSSLHSKPFIKAISQAPLFLVFWYSSLTIVF